MTAPTALDVIRTKRDGGELADGAIRWFVAGVCDGTVSAEQAAALLMAVVWRGLSPRELSTWTAAMVASGERLDLSPVTRVGRPTVDKHSTGGVGDKVSLVLCPLVAACGAAVPQLSGRGLGHTGGTLDKLAAMPGWRGDLSAERFVGQLAEVGAVIAAPGPGLAPADRILYALRDVTGTVESVPLIASSILSKKLAEGTDALVLDVKVGSGAFLPDVASARALASTMVELGAAEGLRTSALLTDMSRPLGRSAGNAVEVAEAVEVLAGGGPPDTVALTVALAREMLDLAGLGDADPAAALAGGAAMDVWRRMLRAQGGDPDAALPRPRHVELVAAPADGVVTRLDARSVGEAAWRLGAGRAQRDHPVQPAAGVVWRVGPGDRVRRGDTLFELHTDTPERIGDAAELVLGALTLGDGPPAPGPLVLERIPAPAAPPPPVRSR